MKKALVLTLVLLLLFNCSSTFAMNRTYEDAISFDVYYNSLYSINNETPFDDLRFDLPYANNDDFYYNPPIMIYKQNGKISAIEIETVIWKKVVYNIGLFHLAIYCLVFEGSTELDIDKLESLRPFIEGGSSKPLQVTENYTYYYDEPHYKHIFVYTGQ